MKILFAIKAMDGATGGAERVLAEIASRLAAEGHDIALLSFDPPGGQSFFPLHPAIRRLSLPIGNPARRATLPETLRRLPALRRAATREKPDIAIGFMHSMFVLLGPALAGTGIPVIGSEHTNVETYRAHPLQAWLLRLSLWTLAAITVPAEDMLDAYPAFARSKIRILPNPVSVGRSSKPPAGAPPEILAAGRLQPVKDHATLIEAFARLARDFPDWRLRIAGDGPLRPQLEAQIRAHGLESRITLSGIVADMAGAYAGAAIFAMPSLHESFGLSLAEALAAGLPAIGFADCAGSRALIQNDHNGLLVGSGDRSWRLAEGLGRLMRDAELRRRLAERAPASVERYRPERIAGEWKRLLGAVVEKQVADAPLFGG